MELDFPVIDAHRILFGTDAPWQEPAKVLAALLELSLTNAEYRAICFDNANELFQLRADFGILSRA